MVLVQGLCIWSFTAWGSRFKDFRIEPWGVLSHEGSAKRGSYSGLPSAQAIHIADPDPKNVIKVLTSIAPSCFPNASNNDRGTLSDLTSRKFTRKGPKKDPNP